MTWVFRYWEDPADETARELGEDTPLRPVVGVRLRAEGTTSARVPALVDSGSERCFAAPGLGRQLGLDLDAAIEVRIGLGASWRRVRFADVEIELFQNVLSDDAPPLATWSAPVGFLTDWTPAWPVLLGQKGFFDQFTITMHRSVPALVVEPWGTFDDRFGVVIETVDTTQPRFRP